MEVCTIYISNPQSNKALFLFGFFTSLVFVFHNHLSKIFRIFDFYEKKKTFPTREIFYLLILK